MGCEGSVMEDPDNEYDSTWDDEYEEHPFGLMRATRQRTWRMQRNLLAARDMQRFRHSCKASLTATTALSPRHVEKNVPYIRHDYVSHHGQGYPLSNLYFYQNRIPSRPDGVYIEEFHRHWSGDYTRLERMHTYIQWLFPNQEPGVNLSTQTLSLPEIMHFREDKTLQKRLLKSYKLMLDFYGIKLVNEVTGSVQRAGNWRERFENLNRHPHNNLRITRILKCLGLLGFPHYQAPLVYFFLCETLVNGTLPQVKQSVLDYFIFAVLDRFKRKDLIRFAFLNYEPKEQFVWCPRRIQRRFLQKQHKHPLRTSAGARRVK